MHGGNVVRSYHVPARAQPHRPEGALGRLPHSRGQLPARAPQSAQRLLPVDQGVLPERRRTCRRARAHHWDTGGSIMIHGLPNLLKHDPEYYAHARLDRRLHRGVQCRHGRDLDARLRRHADRHPPLTASEQRVFRVRRRARRPARQPREPFADRDRQAARYRPGGAVPAVPPLRAGGAQLRGAHRQRQGDLRPLPRLRHPHRAPPLGREARDAERAGGRLRRRRR